MSGSLHTFTMNNNQLLSFSCLFFYYYYSLILMYQHSCIKHAFLITRLESEDHMQTSNNTCRRNDPGVSFEKSILHVSIINDTIDRSAKYIYYTYALVCHCQPEWKFYFMYIFNCAIWGSIIPVFPPLSSEALTSFSFKSSMSSWFLLKFIYWMSPEQ